MKYQFVVILNIRSLIDLFQRYAYEYIHLRALARIGRARACMRFPPCSRANDLYANPAWKANPSLPRLRQTFAVVH